MDLVIPGEQHIYLRAANAQERQQWLVALGSTKACVTTRARKDSGESNFFLKPSLSCIHSFFLPVKTLMQVL